MSLDPLQYLEFSCTAVKKLLWSLATFIYRIEQLSVLLRINYFWPNNNQIDFILRIWIMVILKIRFYYKFPIVQTIFYTTGVLQNDGNWIFVSSKTVTKGLNLNWFTVSIQIAFNSFICFIGIVCWININGYCIS